MQPPVLSPDALAALFAEAKHQHQHGALDQAEAGYRAILAAMPEHAGALQFLGVLSAQHGDLPQAIAFLEQSVQHDPHVPGAWFNLGRCYHQHHAPDQAVNALQQCLKQDPARDEARLLLVTILLAQHADPAEIMGWLQPKLKAADDWRWADFAAHASLRKRDLTGAISFFDQVLRLGGDPVTTGANKANLLAQTGQYRAARDLAHHILGLSPDHTGARTALGWAHLGLEEHAAAAACFEPLWQQNPQDHALRLGYALACIVTDPATATMLIDERQAAHPDDVDYRAAQGQFLTQRRDFVAALRHYQDLLEHHPNRVDVWQSAGFAAELSLGPSAARSLYEQGRALFPDHPGLRLGLARCALTEGDGSTGWAAFEHRFGHMVQAAETPGNGWPAWHPGMVVQHLVLYTEQGIGDLFQFLRYIALVPPNIPRLSLYVPASVHGLLGQQPLLRDINLVSDRAMIVDADAAVSLMSLPFHLTPDQYCPPTGPYLCADPARIIHWRQKLAALPPGLKIGLNWQGSRSYALDDLRSPPLRHFERWLGWQDAIWINLQQGAGHEQLASTAFGGRVIDWTADMDQGAGNAFVDTAALLCGLDLVITSDTALAHLAGALGVACWLMVPFRPDWRWGIAGTDCPWYPAMRLFRQPAQGDWDAVAAAIDAAWHNGAAADFAGSIAFLRGDFTGAIRLFQQACARSPDQPDYRGKLALTYNETGQYRALATESARLNTDAPDALMTRLIACWAAFHQGAPAQALADISALYADYPAHPSVAAAAVMIPLKHDPALALERALLWLERTPDDRNMGLNAAMAAARLCDWDQAIKLLDPPPDAMLALEQIRYYGFRDGPVATLPRLAEFLERWPHDPHALTLRGHYRLAIAPSREGWADYESRLNTGFQTPRCVIDGMRLWDGHPAPKQHLLIDDEQGIGDLFQMLRFIPQVKSMVRKITLRCRTGLHPLLRLQPILHGIDLSDDGDCADIAIPIMSLPHVLKTGNEIAPAHRPVMIADPRLSAHWKERLSGLPAGRRIGLNWQGSSSYSADYLRSVPLAALSSLRDIPDIQWINLQQGFGHEQIAQTGWDRHLHDWTAGMDGAHGIFMDTAALLSNLDLVITSDTALAHLAGSLDVPTWLMTSYHPDWRWGLTGHHCAWYPSMRLFRQAAQGDWVAVAADIAQALCP